jgi:hypothetical protein
MVTAVTVIALMTYLTVEGALAGAGRGRVVRRAW